MKKIILGFMVGVFALPSLVLSEEVEIRAGMSVDYVCTGKIGDPLTTCLISLPVLQNIKIPLEKNEETTQPGYEQWNGSWTDTVNENGITFVGSIAVTKNRFYDEEDKEWSDYYFFKATAGKLELSELPMTSGMTAGAPSLDQLPSLSVSGTATKQEDKIFYPTLHFGPVWDFVPVSE